MSLSPRPHCPTGGASIMGDTIVVTPGAVTRGGGGAPTPSLGIDCETDPESGGGEE